ncbi:MAG: hypothetical protein JSR21_22840, partial [Proteobacteria bacterium]|nr:hypothetical protein [Pseudomonadota bacterium]
MSDRPGQAASGAERELARAPAAGLEAATAFNAPVFESHAALTAALRQHLGAEAADAFARPVRSGADIAWTTAVPGPARAWTALSPAERAALEARRRGLGESLAGLADRLRRSGANTPLGNLSHLLEAAMTVPGPEHLWQVGDRLVLTFWGFRAPGRGGFWPLGPEPPVLPPPPAPPRRLWPWLLGLLLLLLAL